jgi:2-isopropylmalate synthase
VGKSWDKQVKSALGISEKENLRMIGDSIAHVVAEGREALYDAEHFFDGYKSNPEFAISCLKAALDNGARWIVLCDTNGGSLPFEIEEIVTQVTKHIPGKNLGVHCHNDTDAAVANSLAAVRAGVRQVQGTINGIGERCGNANLISIIPNLMLKMGFSTGISPEKLTHLKRVSHMLDERLNRASNAHAPYVGDAAFAHKGGLHVSAMAKDSRPRGASGDERAARGAAATAGERSRHRTEPTEKPQGNASREDRGAPQRRELRRLPLEDRPAGTRLGQLRCHRSVSHP